MFERFTDDARRTVVLAKELAQQMGHNWIGTEHLILALLDDPDGIAAQAVTAAGARPEAVRTEIELVVPATVSEVGQRVPFTPRAKKVLELSLRESMRLRHRSIQPGHILLGLIREGQGLAAQALVKQGCDLDDLRQQVARRLVGGMVDPAGMRIVPPEPPHMTRGGVVAFDRARQLAEGGPVGSQHVLLGLLGDEDSLAKRALAALGVTRQAVEQQLAGMDPADTADEPPERAGARRTRLQISGDVVTLRFEDRELAGRLGVSLKRWGRPGEAGEIELPGTEPAVAEPFARLWRTTQAVSREIVQRLESGAAVAPGLGQWKPPGWTTRASVAGYSVTSEPDGPRSRLWTNEDLDEAEVRAWLAAWLEGMTPDLHGHEEVSFFAALVGRKGDANPGAPDSDEWVVTNFSFGAGPAPAEWPRRPLQDLLAFALTDLRRPPDPPASGAPEPPG